jgi:ankyrin repeat protein
MLTATIFFDFIRVVIAGDVAEVSRRLAVNPALATMPSDVGATRLGNQAFFFPEIAHYLYAGDTALHMAAAAFRPRVAERLIAGGADCRAKNRRGAEPLHYAADANRWDPAAQAETITYLISVGADANAVDSVGVAPLHRAVRTRSLAAVRALLDGGAAARRPNKSGRRPCTLPCKPRGGEAVVLRRPANSRPESSGCCWSAAHGRQIGTGRAKRSLGPPPANGSEAC